MQLETAIVIDAEGVPRFIWNDALIDVADALGTPQVCRASRVEPAPEGGFTADMELSGGPVLNDGKPFRKYGDAIAAEHNWLRENRNL